MKHQQLIEEIEDLIEYFDSVTLAKVPAHKKEKGNEGADRLANVTSNRCIIEPLQRRRKSKSSHSKSFLKFFHQILFLVILNTFRFDI